MLRRGMVYKDAVEMRQDMERIGELWNNKRLYEETVVKCNSDYTDDREIKYRLKERG